MFFQVARGGLCEREGLRVAFVKGHDKNVLFYVCYLDEYVRKIGLYLIDLIFNMVWKLIL